MSAGLLRAYSGPWTRAHAAHLLRRAGAGFGRDELDRSSRLGETLEALFHPKGHAPELLAGIDHLLGTGSIRGLQAWWLALISEGGDPLRERVTWMWHDHFATSFDKVDDVRLMHRQNRLFREQGLGDFRLMLHNVARDPAMLVWLDGNLNRRGQPNENFAREVMELFALGIGNYEESDIQEAARAFTGWGTKGRSFHERTADHDSGEKTVLGQTGAFDGGQVLDILLEQPACSLHIADLLLREFVKERPTQEETSELAEHLLQNEWDIEKTLRTLLASELFFAPAHRRNRVGSPLEFTLGSVRALNARVAPKKLAADLERMGQALFRPPSVKGWDGGRAWINASTWVARHEFAFDLVESLDSQTFVRAFGEDHEDIAQSVVSLLLPEGADESFLATLQKAARGADEPVTAFRKIAALVLSSPEYHLS